MWLLDLLRGLPAQLCPCSILTSSQDTRAGVGINICITFIWLSRAEKMLLINLRGFQTLPKCGVELEKCKAGESLVSPQTPLHPLITTLPPPAFANSKSPVFSPK